MKQQWEKWPLRGRGEGSFKGTLRKQCSVSWWVKRRKHSSRLLRHTDWLFKVERIVGSWKQPAVLEEQGGGRGGTEDEVWEVTGG